MLFELVIILCTAAGQCTQVEDGHLARYGSMEECLAAASFSQHLVGAPSAAMASEITCRRLDGHNT